MEDKTREQKAAPVKKNAGVEQMDEKAKWAQRIENEKDPGKKALLKKLFATVHGIFNDD